MFGDLSRTTQLKKEKWEDTTGHSPNISSLLLFRKEKSIIFPPLQIVTLFNSRGGFSWSDSVTVMFFPLLSNWSRHENGTRFGPMRSKRKLTLGLLDRLSSFLTQRYLVLALPLGALVWGCGAWGTLRHQANAKEENQRTKVTS